MVNDLRKAAEQALEAMQEIEPYVDRLIDYASTAAQHPLNNAPKHVEAAITALREALAKPDVPTSADDGKCFGIILRRHKNIVTKAWGNWEIDQDPVEWLDTEWAERRAFFSPQAEAWRVAMSDSKPQPKDTP